MIDQKIGKACTACTACMNACPKAAIHMEADSEGFFYPSVNYAQCCKCNVCEKTCPILRERHINQYDEPCVYAAWNLNPEIRISSTSGGVFSALADAFLKQGGYVVGAIYGEHFEILHTIIHAKERVPELRQSKYAQSALNDIFQQIRELLKKGERVLFCGTPCQSAGLQAFLAKPYVNLYCCDFICRGVISSKVYKKYLKDIEKAFHEKITKVHFKNKDFGWNRFSTKLTFRNGTYYQQDRYHDCYLKGYLNYNLYLRPSCYQCRFKKLPRESDMSLGDFWGIGKYRSELDVDKGTSVILVNSKKGSEMLSWMQDGLYVEKRSLDEVLEGNACLLHAATVGKFRSYFFRKMDHVRFDRLIKRIEKKAMGLTPKETILGCLHSIKVKLCRKGS